MHGTGTALGADVWRGRVTPDELAAVVMLAARTTSIAANVWRSEARGSGTIVGVGTLYRRKPPREVHGRVRSPKRAAPTPVRRVDVGQPSTVHERVVVEVPEPEKLLTLEEAAAASEVSLHTLKRRVARGLVPAVRIGRSVRLRLSDLEEASDLAGRDGG